MNIKKMFSITLLSIGSFMDNTIFATSNFNKGLTTTALVACAFAQSSNEEKILKNKKGETFTFHGNDTVSIKDCFDNDLGIYKTNNNNPLPFQSIEFIKEGDQKGVFVGLGLQGGYYKCQRNSCINHNNCNVVVNFRNVQAERDAIRKELDRVRDLFLTEQKLSEQQRKLYDKVTGDLRAKNKELQKKNDKLHGQNQVKSNEKMWGVIGIFIGIVGTLLYR